MAIRRIERVFCSLNLGLIYSVNYSYAPANGVAITIFFENETGEYTTPKLLPMQKANIRIGSASFSMYPKSWTLTKAAGKRVIKVDFVDETYQLENYYITLRGRGCGQNIYPLGTPVDNRTETEKILDALDPKAQEVRNFTDFPDIEYSFNDFLAVLRKKFNVKVTAEFDQTITNTFVGTFRSVLDSWCSFYNLSFYFENGVMKIVDPTKLNISLPVKPDDALDYETEEDIGDTYGVTAANYFQQNGNEVTVSKGDFIRTNTLFPAGYEFGLEQTTLDLNQVIAAMYGEQFWFLYNRYMNTTEEQCGWKPEGIPIQTNPGVKASLNIAGLGAASVDEDKYNQKYQAYLSYGRDIGGRWYFSNEVSDIALEQSYEWFDETAGQIFNFATAQDKHIAITYLTPITQLTNAIEGTVVNKYFQGINYVGNRMAYRDTYEIDWNAELGLTDYVKNLIAKTYAAIFNTPGDDAFKFPVDKKYVAYQKFETIPQDLVSLFQAMPDKFPLVQPRFDAIAVKGVSKSSYPTLVADTSTPNKTEVITTQTPTEVNNIGTIKAIKNGSAVTYYNKYEDCASANSADAYYGYRFNIKQISDDAQIGITFSNLSTKTYKISRDLTVINQLVNNPLLPQLAQARTFSTKRVSFTLNYFYDIPVNFLTDGLANMDISVAGDGINSSYTFSNGVLKVPDVDYAFMKMDERIRNSWIRTYRPKGIVT